MFQIKIQGSYDNGGCFFNIILQLSYSYSSSFSIFFFALSKVFSQFKILESQILF